jgi:hypothetical protein
MSVQLGRDRKIKVKKKAGRVGRRLNGLQRLQTARVVRAARNALEKGSNGLY